LSVVVLMYCNGGSVTDFCTYFFFFSSRRRHTRSKRDWSSDVCSSDLQHYERACRIMTGEANAIIEGALDHGASDILVNDSHSSMTNLLVDELHPEATIITGGNKP